MTLDTPRRARANKKGSQSWIAGRLDFEVNQKARTRAALLAAAVKLVREGRPPSIPDAAVEALVSTATAYRYFTSADDLWEEAALQAFDLDTWADDANSQVEHAAGRMPWSGPSWPPAWWPDTCSATSCPCAVSPRPAWTGGSPVTSGAPRLKGSRSGPAVATRPTGWSSNRSGGPSPTTSSTDWSEPSDSFPDIDAVLALVDGLNLDNEAAMATLVDANRWIIAGAVAEAKARRRRGE